MKNPHYTHTIIFIFLIFIFIITFFLTFSLVFCLFFFFVLCQLLCKVFFDINIHVMWIFHLLYCFQKLNKCLRSDKSLNVCVFHLLFSFQLDCKYIGIIW